MTTNKVLNSPAFLEHNNSFYIFFSDDSGVLYAVDTDGNSLENWPIDTEETISKSVAFSDLDGDGEAEVIALTGMTDVLVYNLDGSSHDGFPMDNEFVFTAAPIVVDMDDDGDLEILGGSVNSLVALDIKSTGSSGGFWSMYRGSAERTGYYRIDCSAEIGDLNCDGEWDILDVVALVNCVLLSNCAGLQNGYAGDINSDDGWNVLDIIALANCVLIDECMDL